MYRLLSGPSAQMANEMERIYRNQIWIYQQEFDDAHLSAKGILKARLFGATFIVFAFANKWEDESALKVMANASSGVAMEPFASPSYQPAMDRDVAASFAGSFFMDVFRAIASEMRDGPSPLEDKRDKLQKVKECALLAWNAAVFAMQEFEMAQLNNR